MLDPARVDNDERTSYIRVFFYAGSSIKSKYCRNENEFYFVRWLKNFRHYKVFDKKNTQMYDVRCPPWNWHHKCIIHDDFCLKKQTKMIEVFINVIVYEDNIHYF
jgi:hypothetical protein